MFYIRPNMASTPILNFFQFFLFRLIRTPLRRHRRRELQSLNNGRKKKGVNTFCDFFSTRVPVYGSFHKMLQHNMLRWLALSDAPQNLHHYQAHMRKKPDFPHPPPAWKPCSNACGF